MHIAIIGKGTSSIITSLRCIERGHKVTIYSDPNKPHISVGESTTPHIKDLLYRVLNINLYEMCANNITSMKTGVKFINWGKGVDFYHHFINDVAFHFDTKKFNPFIHNILENNNLASYIEERVDNYCIQDNSVNINERYYDFAIFCSGWESSDEYYDPIFQTVNSALLYVENNVDTDNTYTIHRATEDGWQFGLPFPKDNITKCGYLYDRNLFPTENLKDKVQHLNILRNFEWNPAYSKKLIQNNYCAYNGNRLFFIEPLQALSLYYYDVFATMICDYLDSNRSMNTFFDHNNNYIREMLFYQLSLAYHYKHGSTHDTNFWKKIMSESNNMLRFYSGVHDEFYYNSIVADFITRTTNYSSIGAFRNADIIQLHCGFNQEKFEDIYAKYATDLISFS